MTLKMAPYHLPKHCSLANLFFHDMEYEHYLFDENVLNEAIDSIPLVLDRYVFRQRWICHRTARDIAEEMGVSSSMVRAREYRAIRRIKSQLLGGSWEL